MYTDSGELSCTDLSGCEAVETDEADVTRLVRPPAKSTLAKSFVSHFSSSLYTFTVVALTQLYSNKVMIVYNATINYSRCYTGGVSTGRDVCSGTRRLLSIFFFSENVSLQ